MLFKLCNSWQRFKAGISYEHPHQSARDSLLSFAVVASSVGWLFGSKGGGQKSSGVSNPRSIKTHASSRKNFFGAGSFLADPYYNHHHQSSSRPVPESVSGRFLHPGLNLTDIPTGVWSVLDRVSMGISYLPIRKSHPRAT